MSLWRPAIVTVTVAASVLAGCGTSTAGQPTPPTGARQTGTTTSTTASSAPPLTELTNDQICDLLTAAEATQLGGSETGRPSFSTTNAHPLCQWSKDTSLNIDFGRTPDPVRPRPATGSPTP